MATAAAAPKPATAAVAISDAPVDGISALAWLDGSTLVSSNWDSSVRLFSSSSSSSSSSSCAASSTTTFSARGAWRQHKAPVLDVCAGPALGSALSGGVDCDVHLSRGEPGAADGGASDVLGSHREAVRCVLYCAEARLCASGSWDSTVALWDPNQASGSAARAAGTLQLPDKCFAMCTQGGGGGLPRLVVGTAGRQLLTYDLRQLGAGPVATKESPLKHQTRCIRASPAGDFLAVGCTEGRVAIEFAAAEQAARSYAFKCHRKKEADGGETVFPVHALAFHPSFGTFATGGGDAQVAFWDGAGRKRLAAVGPFANSITALAFSPDGGRLAIASSYDFCMGDNVAHAPDAVLVKAVADCEVRPKAPAAVAPRG